MNVRAIGVAVALLLATACRTSSTQSSGAGGTARAPSDTGTSATGSAQAPTDTQPTDTQGTSAGGSAQAPSDTSPSTAAEEPGHEAQPGAGASASSDAQGTSPSSASSSTGQDPLVEPGPAIKGHASDQLVSGEIGEVSGSWLTISSYAGDETMLEIAPETTITIDGMEASAADLEEGQPVRASYSEVEGHAVAVEIEAGEDSSSEPKELGISSGSEPPASSGGASEPGASGTGDAGSSGPGASGTGSAGGDAANAQPR
jgi:hypothetical protein